ncbi:helix-turn-helix transcriptional regulator [Enterococcus faecium]|uniref:helix-turn-helix domain-containing protein n=1 Tax=Enterococcus faecium TaxID=1352 RepID=UPI0035147344|nr:helix-turn-helix transcriptional regulator [Enterococcus faecium]
MLWSELKEEIALPNEEKEVLDSLIFLINERKEQKVSQKELAERIGMKQSQLSKIENLTSVPSMATLNRYATGLGLSMTISFTKPIRGQKRRQKIKGKVVTH